MSDDFLSRWSRRKREVVDEAVPEPAPPAPVEEAAPEESDEEVLARLGLRHPDEMGPGDDFAAFLRSAAPRHLKTRAYRRLWRSNPTLACLDGLNDYDGDFTGTGVAQGGLKTAYQVGRGLLGRIAEVAEDRGTDVPAETEEPGASAEADVPEAGNPVEPRETVQSAESVHQDDTRRATRRRMVFRSKGGPHGS